MKRIYVLSLLLLILSVSVLYLYLNKKEEVIKIGFVGALTAKYSVLGNAMMNGVILAFEEENYNINGKKIELIFKDDKKDEETNKQIVNDFISQGIKIVIGNVTSSMSKISMSIINKHPDMFMISAASASNEFSGKDDQFFRVHVANNEQRFSNFTTFIKDSGYKKIYGIYDFGNVTYTKDYLENFEKSLVLHGGENFVKYSKIDDLDILLNDIKKEAPDLILICADSIDTAKVVQYLRLNQINIEIASSEWAMTSTLLENTGRNSEGMIFNMDYDENSKNEEFIKFKEKYEEKYNMPLSLYATKGYELAKVIIELLKVGNETELKKNLLLKKEFAGLQGNIVFDQYGDVTKEFNTFKIINGKFEKIK